MTFIIKHCVWCEHSRFSPPDYSVGIDGPALEDCSADVCPFGNIWEEYMSDDIDWTGEEEAWNETSVEFELMEDD